MEFKAEGVIPATLVAFETDFDIDIAASRKHLRDVAGVVGLSAITVNGHASEIHAFSFAEQQQLLAASLDEVGDALPLINGVYADGSHAAVAVAKMAASEVKTLASRRSARRRPVWCLQRGVNAPGRSICR